MTIDFCVVIPVWNRETEIQEALASFTQLVQTIEGQKLPITLRLVVSDNCSSDATIDVVRNAREASRLRRWEIMSHSVHMTFPRHIATLLESISADWVMFLGSDDSIVVPNAVDFLRRLASQGEQQAPDVFVLGRNICSSDLKLTRKDAYLYSTETTEVDFDLRNHRLIASYFDQARTVNALGCFISSLVVSRNAMKAMASFSGHRAFAESIFPHVYALWAAVECGLITRLAHYQNAVVNWRGGNSSFESNAVEKVSDLKLAGSAIFEKLSTRGHFLKLLHRHYRRSFLLALLRPIPSFQDSEPSQTAQRPETKQIPPFSKQFLPRLLCRRATYRKIAAKEMVDARRMHKREIF